MWQVEPAQAPWRPLGIGAGAVAVPTVISYVHSVFGLVLASGEALTIALLLAAALFGTSTISERAFRLLRWLANRPEPAAPPRLTSPSSDAGPDDPSASGQ
jgi:hypothetical protein